MRWFVLFVLLEMVAFGQVRATRVTSQEATKHCIELFPPVYPPSAELARISGNVILEVLIDESGVASAGRLVSGHPMLVSSAMSAVNLWKYRPFEVDGKLASVLTFVMVSFGNSANNAQDAKEMLFQDTFWSYVNSAQEALAKRDFALAESRLLAAGSVLSPHKDESRHASERWQWLTTKGHLRMAQENYGEAEENFKYSLALRQKDKDSLELAQSLADLGELSIKQKRDDLARDYLSDSVAIFRKHFKKLRSRDTSARQAYGSTIANHSVTLLRLASQRNDARDVDKQCQTLTEFRAFLSETDRESSLSACKSRP
jgi:TonB family protein